MKDYFAFFIKLVVGSILLMPSVDPAVSSHFFEEKYARGFARSYWKDISNWEDAFVLKDGSVIRHTAHDITLERDGVVVQSLKQEFFIEKKNGNEYHAIDLRMPLSRADFLRRLCESELYQKTKQDGKVLADNSNWEAEISVMNLTINDVECCTVWHKPDGIRFKSQGGFSINLSRAYTNQYGHIQYSSHTYSTKELFLVHKENGRPVCLSVELSCIEFTKTLFDSGHVMFQSYPPYTVQEMPDGRFTYYYYGDLKEPVKKRQIVVAPVRNIGNENVIISGVEPRENVRRVQFSNTNQTFILAPVIDEVSETAEDEEPATVAVSNVAEKSISRPRWTSNPLNPFDWIKFYAPKKIDV